MIDIRKICSDNGIFDSISDEYQILHQKIHKNISDIFNDFCLNNDEVEISVYLYPDSGIEITLYLDYIGATVKKILSNNNKYRCNDEYLLKVSDSKFTMSDMIFFNDIFKEFCELLMSNIDLIIQYCNTKNMIYKNYNSYQDIYIKYYDDMSKTINEDELIRLIKLDVIIK